MYNRPYFTPWVNAKKFLLHIPPTEDAPHSLYRAPEPEFQVGQTVIFDSGDGSSPKIGTVVRKPYKDLGLYDVDFDNGYLPERICCDELKPLSLKETGQDPRI